MFGNRSHRDEDLELEDFDLLDMDEELSEEYTEDTAGDFTEEYTEEFAEEFEEDFENLEDSETDFAEENTEEFAEFEESEEDFEEFAEEDAADFAEEDEVWEEDDTVYAEEAEDFEDFDDEADLEELDLESGEESPVYVNAKQDEDDDEEVILGWEDMPDKNIFQKIWYSLVHMSTMDRILTTTGIFILILALAAGTLYVDNLRRKKAQLTSSELAVGTQLEGVSIVGEKGLLAISNHEKAKYEIPDDEDNPEDDGYDENDYVKDIAVLVNLTSIEKDLKIKFVNKDTGKLIANVPFEVEITTPDKKTEVWTDDDMDGIIYKSSLTPGKYTVTLKELTDEKYKAIAFDTTAKKADVRKEIAYEKVDVSNEIKKDNEVAAGEDGGKDKDEDVESTLKDTVAWVESTKVVLEDAYTPVDKKTITDPISASVQKAFIRMGSLNLAAMQLNTGESKNVTLPQIDGVTFGAPTLTSSDSSVASIQGSSVVAGNPGSATISVSVTGTKAGDTSGGNSTQETYTGTFTVTVTADSVAVTGVTISQSQLTLYVGDETTLTAQVNPENATNKEVVWSSGSPDIVSVENGKVKALKQGSATITVKSSANPGCTAACQVTVKEKTESRTLSVDSKNLAMSVGGKAEIKATVTDASSSGSVSGVVECTVDKTDVLDVATGSEKNGVTTFTVSAKKNGTATLTFTLRGSALTAQCKVTVSDRTINLEKSSLSVVTGGKNSINASITSQSGSFSVETSASDVATATVSGTDKDANGNLTAKIEVTGIKAGSATITVIHTENGAKVQQAFAVKVVSKETKLVDKNNQQYYVKEGNDQYREATYADYYDASITTLYLKTAGKVKYTGWQTIEGKRYYFDINGNYVTGEQVIQGAKYTFASDGSLVTGSGNFGIDVSKWNGNIDWNAVKNSGVSYVIIRSGYRGSSLGSLVADPKFEANIKGANAAGIKVGIYFYTQAVNKAEAVEEASMVLQQVKNYKVSYPIFIDVEDTPGGRANGLDKATRTEVIKAFCQTIQNSGYTAGVYANKNWLTEKIDTGQLGSYKIWLAQYAAQPTYSGRYDIWQYRSTGKINGISGDVDLNISYLGY